MDLRYGEVMMVKVLKEPSRFQNLDVQRLLPVDLRPPADLRPQVDLRPPERLRLPEHRHLHPDQEINRVVVQDKQDLPILSYRHRVIYLHLLYLHQVLYLLLQLGLVWPR